jgi:hypothetical protein
MLGELPLKCRQPMAEFLGCKELLLCLPIPKGEMFEETPRLLEKSGLDYVECAHDKLAGRKYAKEVCAHIWQGRP